MSIDIDKEIEQIELDIPSVSGVSISRCMLDVRMFEEQGIKLKEGDNKEAVLVWCLSVGVMNMPKTFYYGRTIKDTIKRYKKKNKALKTKCVCSLCYALTQRNTAHRWQGKYIGECCWDDRLKTTE